MLRLIFGATFGFWQYFTGYFFNGTTLLIFWVFLNWSHFTDHHLCILITICRTSSPSISRDRHTLHICPSIKSTEQRRGGGALALCRGSAITAPAAIHQPRTGGVWRCVRRAELWDVKFRILLELRRDLEWVWAALWRRAVRRGTNTSWANGSITTVVMLESHSGAVREEAGGVQSNVY